MRRVCFALTVMASLASPAHAQRGPRPVLSTWFGGPGQDGFVAAAVSRDGSILLAGTTPGAAHDFTPAPRVRRGEGDGVALRLSPGANRVLAVVRMPGPLTDGDTDAKGDLLLVGPKGSRKLDASLATDAWTSDVGGEGARIAPGPDGGAVVLAGKTVTVLGGDGATVGSWEVQAEHAADIACDPKAGRVFLTGSNTKGSDPKIHVAYVHAYDMQGMRQWVAYDHSVEALQALGSTAPTAGVLVVLGEDGKLYVGGTAGGGNHMFRNGSVQPDEPVTLVTPDKYQHPYNTGGARIGFLGRMDPATGVTERGTMMLARTPDGDHGNTMVPLAVTADARGLIHVVGRAAAEPPVSPGMLGSHFKGGGAFFWVLGPTFERALAAKPAGGEAHAVAVGKGTIVCVGEAAADLARVKPFRAAPEGTDAWAVVLKLGR